MKSEKIFGEILVWGFIIIGVVIAPGTLCGFLEGLMPFATFIIFTVGIVLYTVFAGRELMKLYEKYK